MRRVAVAGSGSAPLVRLAHGLEPILRRRVVQHGDRAVHDGRREQQAAPGVDLESRRQGGQEREQVVLVGLDAGRCVPPPVLVLQPGGVVYGHARAVERRHVQPPAAECRAVGVDNVGAVPDPVHNAVAVLPSPVPVPAVAAGGALSGGIAPGVDRIVVQPRVHYVHLARLGVGLHVDDARVPAGDGVAAKQCAAARVVRLHGRRAAQGAQVRHAPAGVDRQVRRAGAAGARSDRPGHVVRAAGGRRGVDHPLQLRGGLRLDHVHVGPLLRRGVHRSVPADLD